MMIEEWPPYQPELSPHHSFQKSAQASIQELLLTTKGSILKINDD